MNRLLFVLHNAWTIRSHTVDVMVVLLSLRYSNTTCTIFTETLISTFLFTTDALCTLVCPFDHWWTLYSQGCNSENRDGPWNVRVDVNTTITLLCVGVGLWLMSLRMLVYCWNRTFFFFFSCSICWDGTRDARCDNVIAGHLLQSSLDVGCFIFYINKILFYKLLVRPVRALEVKPDCGGLDMSRKGTINLETLRMELLE